MNSIYDIARYQFAVAMINWQTAPLVLLAYSGEPEFVPEDTSINDITTRGNTLMVKQSQTVLGKNVTTQGYLQTADVVFETVPVGFPITHFIVANKPSTLPLATPLLYIDEAENLPFTPNGLDIVVTPDWLAHRGWGRL